MNNKYIITGAPSSGKTSIVNELISRGFNCIHENSREVISEQLRIGGKILPWENQIEFENKITGLRIQQYIESPKQGVVFFDRSPFDSIAYLNLNKLHVSDVLLKSIKKCKFNKTVFYTPVWKEIYTNDNERIENINQAIKIEKAIISTYRSNGFQLIKVPKSTIEERVDFIISII